MLNPPKLQNENFTLYKKFISTNYICTTPKPNPSFTTTHADIIQQNTN